MYHWAQNQALYLQGLVRAAFSLVLLYTTLVGSALVLTVVCFSAESTLLLRLRVPADIILIS